MQNLDPSQIKLTRTFSLPMTTIDQLAELKFRTGRDMSQIIADLVSVEHTRLTSARPTPSNRPSPAIIGG